MSNIPISQVKRLIVPLLTLSAVSNLAVLISPIFMMQVLDRVVPTGNLSTLLLLLSVAAVALMLQSAVDFLRDLSFQRAARWVERIAVPAVLAAPADQRGGRLTQLTQVRTVLAGPAAPAALSLPWLPLFMLVLWVIHPGFVALTAALIALAAGIRLSAQAMGAAWQNARQQSGDVEQAFLQDAEKIAREPGMAAPARNLIARFLTAAQDRADIDAHLAPIETGAAALGGYLRAMTQLLGLSLGAALVVQGALSAGGMIAASLIVTKTVTSFESVFGNGDVLRSAARAFRALQSLPMAIEESGTDIPDLSGALRAEGLISPRGGGALPRLDRLNFELTPGQCMAIVGASGSGKSTLLDALSGVSPCPIGTVWLQDSEIKTLPLTSRTRHIGYLPQQAQLYHGTLAANICGFAPNPDTDHIVAATQMAGVHGLISALPASYDTDIGAEPFLLSAGQKQRVALARAIFHSPRYLFLDEPNALLDAAGERQLCAVLARLKKQGTTVVMVLHRSGLMGLADVVLAMEGGRMADFGPRSEVLGRMSGGRRRIELPLLQAALQDLTDWVGAQFSRTNDMELSQRAELIAAELFNLALASGPQDERRQVVFFFKFLSDQSCEITLTENRATKAQSKMHKVAALMHRPEADMSALPGDEVAIAVISQMSDDFDIRNVDGQAVYRAALSMRAVAIQGVPKH